VTLGHRRRRQPSASVRRWRRWPSTSALKRRGDRPFGHFAAQFGHIGRVGEWAGGGGGLSRSFRQRRGLDSGRAFGGLDQTIGGAVLCRRSSRGRPAHARFRSLAGRGRQGQCRKPRRQALPPDALIGPDGALRRSLPCGADPRRCATIARRRRNARLWRAQGSGLALLCSSRRLAHRQQRIRAGPEILNGMFSRLPRLTNRSSRVFDAIWLAISLGSTRESHTRRRIMTPGRPERAARESRPERVPLGEAGRSSRRGKE
jgi:hypothetical protein